MNNENIIEEYLVSPSLNEAFFFSDDLLGRSIDAKTLYKELNKKYPLFNHDQSELNLKKLFINILYDKEFVLKLLNDLDISLLEFFKLIYYEYGFIFSNYFIKKIRLIMVELKYV